MSRLADTITSSWVDVIARSGRVSSISRSDGLLTVSHSVLNTLRAETSNLGFVFIDGLTPKNFAGWPLKVVRDEDIDAPGWKIELRQNEHSRRIELNLHTGGLTDECIEIEYPDREYRRIVQSEFVKFAGNVYRQSVIGSGVFLSIHPLDLGDKVRE